MRTARTPEAFPVQGEADVQVKPNIAEGSSHPGDASPAEETVARTARRRRPRFLSTLIFLVIVQCLMNGRIGLSFFETVAGIVIFFAAFFVVMSITDSAKFASAATLVFLLLFMGDRSLCAQDVTACILALVCLWLVWAEALVRKKSPGFLFALLVPWLAFSISDPLFRPKPMVLHPERFGGLHSRWDGKKVGVALSGGGYRAALLHAGVLDGLEREGVPVSAISTVSGGAIIGSFYANGGEPKDFAQAVESGRFNLRRELSHIQNLLAICWDGPLQLPALPRWMSNHFMRVGVQANLLDSVFLNEVKTDHPDLRGPQLMTSATDLRSGQLVGFMRNGVIVRRFTSEPVPAEIVNELARGSIPPDWEGALKSLADEEKTDGTAKSDVDPKWKRWIQQYRSQFDDLRDVDMKNWGRHWYPADERLSTMVAISGAFPVAFGAYPLNAIDGKMADGGLLDNSGLSMLAEADRLAAVSDFRKLFPPPNTTPLDMVNPDTTKMLAGWNIDVVVGSDAGAPFLPEGDDDGGVDFLRAMDTIYSRVGPAKPKSPKLRLPPDMQEGGTPVAIISASALVPPVELGTSDRTYHPSNPEVENRRYRLVEDGIDGLTPEEFSTLIDGLPKADEMKKLAGFALDRNIDHLEARAAELMKHPRSLLATTPKEVVDELARRKTATPATKPYSEAIIKGMDTEVTGELMNALIDLIWGDLSNCLETFLHADTLKSRFSHEDTNRIYRLGRYLALINFSKIRTQLDSNRRAGQPDSPLGESKK